MENLGVIISKGIIFLEKRLMNKNFLLIIPLLLWFNFTSGLFAVTQEQSVDEFITQIQESLKRKDIPAYLDLFTPDMRQKEEIAIKDIFDVFRIEEVFISSSYSGMKEGNRCELYLNVLFQNPYSALIETWYLELLNTEGKWQACEKEITGSVKNLYRINIPTDKVERVKRVSIRHVDIEIIFDNPVIFYDSIPGLETALIVVGKGYLKFSPSVKREKHHLELFFKKNFLEEKLKYAYLRFSPSFFERNIEIVRWDDRRMKSNEIDSKEAKLIFEKHYSRSFTIENSLNGELLSFLPKGDEVVFEFKGEKRGNFSYIYSPFSKEEVSLYQWENNKIINLYSPRKDEKKKELFISFSGKFDVKDYQIEIDFNPEEFYLSGKAVIEIEPKVNYLNVVKLKFNPNMEILRINDEDKHSLFYTKDNLRKLIYVYFFHLLPGDRKTFIEVYYRGKIKQEKPNSYLDRDLRQGETYLFFPPKYETYLYSRLSYWYPAPPNEDYFTATLKIILPPEYSCVSNGKLINKSELKSLEDLEDVKKMGSSVYKFETKKPVKYLSFVVGKFIKIKEEIDSFPIKLFRGSGLYTYRKDLFEEAKNILRFYKTKFGPYPFEKMSIVQRLWPYSGGHSSASFLILNLPPRESERLRHYKVNSPVDFSRWKGYFLAHEIAHQWWGQSVTWDSYHDQWLSEGLAQFSAVLYLREKYGDNDFGLILKKLSRWTEKKSFWGAITMGSRISYLDFEGYQSIIYNKSSLVLNMLKDLLGDEIFFRGMREFYDMHKYRVANTYDFFKSFQYISGMDLSPFFEKWFYSYKLPEVKVSLTLQEENKDYVLYIKILQLKDVFVFPLWVEWEENGRKSQEKLVVYNRVEDFKIKIENKPKKIKINPNNAVPGVFR